MAHRSAPAHRAPVRRAPSAPARARVQVDRRQAPGTGTWFALVGTVLLVVGACMPWMRTLVGVDPRVVTGLQGDGDWHELAYAALAFAIATAVASVPALTGRRRIEAAAATVVAGIGAGVVGVIARSRVHDAVAHLDRLGAPGGLGTVAETAGGVGTVLAGSVLVLIGGLTAVGAFVWGRRSDRT